MKEWVESPECEKYIKKLEHSEKIDSIYFEKFHNLSKEDRLSIVKKIITKYESDDYVDREYAHGCFPRTPLYYMLFDYGVLYGKESTENLNGYFPEKKVIIDDNIEVSAIFGQGTIIKVNFLEKN